MSDELDRASNILAKAGVLGASCILDGRAASNPHYVREEHKLIARMMGEKIAEKLNPVIEDFIQEAPHGPASVQCRAEMVVMTRAELSELIRCIRTAQRREAMMHAVPSGASS